MEAGCSAQDARLGGVVAEVPVSLDAPDELALLVRRNENIEVWTE